MLEFGIFEQSYRYYECCESSRENVGTMTAYSFSLLALFKSFYLREGNIQVDYVAIGLN